MRLTPMSARRSALAALSLCASCASLDGRAAHDASVDGSTDRSASDAAVADEPSPVADRLAPVADAARCPRGPTPQIDARQFGVVVEPAPHGLSGAIPRSAAIDATGRVYVVGYLESPPMSRRYRAAVWRFRASSTALDETYGTGGLALEPDALPPTTLWYAVTVDAMGRALVAGFTGDDARATGAVARFTAAGRLDDTFGTNGRTAVAPGRVPGGSDAVRPFGMHHDAAGTLVAAGDGSPTDRPSRRGIAFRLGPDGALDDAFGTGGVFGDAGLHGCFDVARDGDDYVLACISEDDRPALLRLDAAGHPVGAFGPDGVSAHAMAPRGFQVRALRRDSAGRWLVAGSISPFYDDSSPSPAAVRFLADGTPDATYGDRGVAVAPGVRQTFAYALGQAYRVTCDDRLMFGASVGTIPLVGAFDRDGRRAAGFGEDGYLRGPTRANTYVSVNALLPVPGSDDLVLVGTLSVHGVALARIAQ
jgi:uncharacterized delta-60 repeat protein